MKIGRSGAGGDWRVLVLFAVTVFTTISAHLAGGGGAPDANTLMLFAVGLSPLILLARLADRGPVTFAAVATIGQLGGHELLSALMRPGHMSESAMPAMADMPGMSHVGHLMSVAPALGAASTGTSPMAEMASGGPGGTTYSMAGMALAHAVAVLATTLLVTLVTSGLRRILARFAVLLRSPRLGWAAPASLSWFARRSEHPRSPGRSSRSLRGPPLRLVPGLSPAAL